MSYLVNVSYIHSINLVKLELFKGHRNELIQSFESTILPEYN